VEWNSSTGASLNTNEPGLIVVFETSPDKLVRDAAGLAGLEELELQNKLKIVFTSRRCSIRSCVPPIACYSKPPPKSRQRIFIDGIGCWPEAAMEVAAERSDFLSRAVTAIDRGVTARNLTAILARDPRLPRLSGTLDMADSWPIR